MRKTEDSGIDMEYRILVSTDDLRKLLSCGRVTAVKIGTDAGAKIQVGKRVLWNRKKVQEYLDASA